MGWWSTQVLPRIVDKVLDAPDVRQLRAEVCSGLSGVVVEIGFGSGLNLPHYPRTVTAVQAVEPSDVAWRIAQPRIAQSGFSVERAGLNGEALTLPDDSAEAVLSTFTFCTIGDLDAALAEIRRVLRPGGTLHFLEHGRSPDTDVARWQDRFQPVQCRVFGGCHLDRPIADHVRRSGMEVAGLRTFYGQGPRPFAYLSLGRARRTG